MHTLPHSHPDSQIILFAEGLLLLPPQERAEFVRTLARIDQVDNEERDRVAHAVQGVVMIAEAERLRLADLRASGARYCAERLRGTAQGRTWSERARAEARRRDRTYTRARRRYGSWPVATAARVVGARPRVAARVVRRARARRRAAPRAASSDGSSGDPPLQPPDGLALLRAVADAARSPKGRRIVGELAAEVRRALDGDDGADPVVAEAARLLARSRRRDRARRRTDGGTRRRAE